METKDEVKAISLQDCINEYAEQTRVREEETQREEAEEFAKREELTKEAFAKIGLTSFAVQGSFAFFNMDGLMVTFVVGKWKYGAYGVYRILDEVCGQCGKNFVTAEYDLSAKGIGGLLVNPQKRYHDCPNWISSTVALPVVQKSTREQLMDALDAYLESRQINTES